jgi:hypothetical protein
LDDLLSTDGDRKRQFAIFFGIVFFGIEALGPDYLAVKPIAVSEDLVTLAG